MKGFFTYKTLGIVMIAAGIAGLVVILPLLVVNGRTISRASQGKTKTVIEQTEQHLQKGAITQDFAVIVNQAATSYSNLLKQHLEFTYIITVIISLLFLILGIILRCVR